MEYTCPVQLWNILSVIYQLLLLAPGCFFFLFLFFFFFFFLCVPRMGYNCSRYEPSHFFLCLWLWYPAAIEDAILHHGRIFHFNNQRTYIQEKPQNPLPGWIGDVPQRPVLRLDYSAHPSMAPKVMLELATEAVAKHPGVIAAAVAHRTGRVAVGAGSVLIMVSSVHRWVVGPHFWP
jgi:hypothetical protein